MPADKENINRRRFIQKTALLTASSPLWSSLIRGSDAGAQPVQGSERAIVHRTLGRTGIKVPVVSLGGTADLGIIKAALDVGLTHFDAAYRYGEGYLESQLGLAFKERSRESLVTCTKVVGLRDNVTGLIPAGVTAREFRADFRRRVEVSLQRMQIDHFDILYLHGVETPELPGLPLVKDTLLELKREGKTRFLGASFHHKELELIPVVVRERIYDVILTSYNFRQPHRNAVGRAIADAAESGLGIIAMKTTAGAYWDRERKHPINVPAALKWILQNEHVHTTIPSVRSFEQLAANVAIMRNLALRPQEREDLEFGIRHGMAGLYCAQCGKCREQCRYNLDIPKAMRAYMYACGYNDPGLARDLLSSGSKDAFACRQCSSCAVSCTMGFRIAERMRDVGRLAAS
jgi:predicted aldo/keto reductase-like oxidoreductase